MARVVEYTFWDEVSYTRLTPLASTLPLSALSL